MNDINLTVKIERAISELRRGGKVVISDANSNLSVLLVSAELIEEKTLNLLNKITFSRPNIILSGNRADKLGLKTDNKPCSILINNKWSVNDILSLLHL